MPRKPLGNTMQHYDDTSLTEIKKAYSELRFKYIDLTRDIFSFAYNMKNERAKEFLQQGVLRRLWLLYRCIENIFDLFPPNRIERLSQDDRLNVEINLHAFLINIYGIIDNAALALAYENDLVGDKSKGKFDPKKINLFEKKFQKKFNSQLRIYLNNKTTQQWYKEYAKNYRDALAHRIPPYIPPAALSDEQSQKFKKLDQEIERSTKEGNFEKASELQDLQEKLGRSNPLFVHSFSEKAKFMYLHPQLIADFATIEELLKILISEFYCKCKKKMRKQRSMISTLVTQIRHIFNFGI